MTEYTGTRALPPSSPGIIIGHLLEENDVSITAAAKGLGISRQSLHRILNGTTGITPEMAVKLGVYFGNGPELWLNLQVKWDLWYVQKKLNKRTLGVKPLLAAA